MYHNTICSFMGCVGVDWHKNRTEFPTDPPGNFTNRPPENAPMTIFIITMGFIMGILFTLFIIGATITICTSYWDYQDKKLRKSLVTKELVQRIEEHVDSRDIDNLSESGIYD